MATVPDPARALAVEYSASVDGYERYWAPVIAPMALPIMDAIPLRRATRVLDFGCGTGRHLPQLCAAAPSALILGVDQAAGMVAAAPRLNQSALALMSGEQLALRSRCFDVVVLAFVLFHLPDPLAGLREVCRVLRPGGTAGCVVWGKPLILPGDDIWHEELDAAGAGPDPRPPEVMRGALMESPEKLTALVLDAGFAEAHVWSATYLHSWTPRELLRMQTTCGISWRRLASLPVIAQESCAARVLARLDEFPAEKLEFRPEVLYATATAPA